MLFKKRVFSMKKYSASNRNTLNKSDRFQAKNQEKPRVFQYRKLVSFSINMTSIVILSDAEIAAITDDVKRGAEALKVLWRALLEDARIKEKPTKLNFANELIVRSPQMWIIVFEARSVTTKMFVTEDLAQGRLAKAYEEAVHRTFAESHDPPFVLSSLQTADAAMLVRNFQAIGTLYCNIPFDVTRPSVAAATLVTVLAPLFLETKRIVARLNERQVDDIKGTGAGARYAATKKLDPLNYPDEDREGIKHATMKAESPFEGQRKRMRDEDEEKPRECNHCKKSFTGKWSAHKKSGNCV